MFRYLRQQVPSLQPPAGRSGRHLLHGKTAVIHDPHGGNAVEILLDAGEHLLVLSVGHVVPKALKTFAKANENLEIKGGLMEGAAVSAAEVEAIASLPSREQLMAQIAGAISGVARGLATTINGVPRGLAQVVKAVAEQKEAA